MRGNVTIQDLKVTCQVIDEAKKSAWIGRPLLSFRRSAEETDDVVGKTWPALFRYPPKHKSCLNHHTLYDRAFLTCPSIASSDFHLTILPTWLDLELAAANLGKCRGQSPASLRGCTPEDLPSHCRGIRCLAKHKYPGITLFHVTCGNRGAKSLGRCIRLSWGNVALPILTGFWRSQRPKKEGHLL